MFPQRADLWSLNPGDLERRGEVAVTPLDDWHIFYFRENAWTNPQSSDATTLTAPAPTAPPNPAAAQSSANLPDGVRLVLTLPSGQAISGTLTRDWMRPTIGGNKPPA